MKVGPEVDAPASLEASASPQRQKALPLELCCARACAHIEHSPTDSSTDSILPERSTNTAERSPLAPRA